MAPEQIVGNPEEASDVYSIGVVAWELLTRQKAKDHLLGMSLQWRVKTVGLPQTVVVWLESLLDEKVDTRVQSAVEAIDSLERLPEFDGEQTRIALPSDSLDWKIEAVRRWLVIVEAGGEPREVACKWLREFGDRCNDGELVGLYHVLHRISLKHSTFRIVEYIQDLVQATPNGAQLLAEWKESIALSRQLHMTIKMLPKWRLFESAKLNRELRQTTVRTHLLQQHLIDATNVWMHYVHADPKDLFRLLEAPRKLLPLQVKEHYIHTQKQSIGMIQIPSLSVNVYISKLLVTQNCLKT